LRDIAKFLEIVEYLRPTCWAMENVPRVAKILEAELRAGGQLERYAKLVCNIDIIDMSEFGLPQRRRRCIVGNFDFDLLRSYRAHLKPIPLREVVVALQSSPFVDPIYGVTVDKLYDHGKEDFLNQEEVRLNRAAKTLHPVYNAMPFPDPLDNTARTITATCTRVSRESVVIQDPGNNQFRRLTLRERATAQGFPISFQFYGASFGQKLQMIGNAVPPLFSFFVAQAFQAVRAGELLSARDGIARFKAPKALPPETPHERSGSKYPPNRRFRMSIPSLNLKSGVRFDLSNSFDGRGVAWGVSFTFGTSKEIRQFALKELNTELLLGCIDIETRKEVLVLRDDVLRQLGDFNAENVQRVWCHRGPSGLHPFRIVDILNESTLAVSSLLMSNQFDGERAMSHIHRVAITFSQLTDWSFVKLFKNTELITAGLLVSYFANARMANCPILASDQAPEELSA